MQNSRICSRCLATATVIVAAAVALYLVRWYQHSHVWSIVTFEVPPGYRGVFSILHDPLGGVTPTREPDEDGQAAYRFVIPSSGVLRSSTLEPLRHWHKLRATTASGAPIPTEGSDAISLRGLGGSQGEISYLIGTLAEHRKWFTDYKKWHRIDPADSPQRIDAVKFKRAESAIGAPLGASLRPTPATPTFSPTIEQSGLIRGPLFAAEHAVGLVVADELFRGGVPGQLALQAAGDVAQVAARDRAVLTGHVGDRLLPRLHGLEYALSAGGAVLLAASCVYFLVFKVPRRQPEK